MGTLPPVNQTITHSIPFECSYALPAEQQCMDDIGAHAPPPLFADGSVTDYLRNHGHGTFGHNAAAASMPPNAVAGDVRYMGMAHQATMHQPHFHPQGSGIALSPSRSSGCTLSISPSPSALAFDFTPLTNAFHANLSGPVHYSTAPSETFASPAGYPLQHYTMSHGLRMASISTEIHGAGIPASSRVQASGDELSTSGNATTRVNHTSTTPRLGGYQSSPRSHPDYMGRPLQTPMNERQRSILSPTTSASPPSGASHSSTGTRFRPDHISNQGTTDDPSPPFPHLQMIHELVSEGQTVVPDIHAKIEKGFFPVNQTWTCYRRNYFSVRCSYSLQPHLPNARLYLKRGRRGGNEQVQALAVSLSASVDQGDGKSIELVQHTPKRDRGPQLEIKIEKLAPKPPGNSVSYSGPPTIGPPYLPLQSDPNQPYSGPDSVNTHTFERIQFKRATANNGKRRAHQQYYHLVVELYADVRDLRDPHPNWVKVAQRISAQVVVRGRSPSHYMDEKGSTSSSTGPGGSGGAGSGLRANGLYGGPGSGYHNSTNGFASLRSSTFGGAGYQTQQYSSDPSPTHSHSVSSSSSVSGGCTDQPMELLDRGPAAFDVYPGYGYYPSPLYEVGCHQGPSIVAPVSAAADERLAQDATCRQDYHNHGFSRVKTEAPVRHGDAWHIGGCGRFQGIDTSRGYGRDLHTGY